MTAQHSAIARLIAQDEVRRQKQAAAIYAISWNPRFLMVHLSNGGCGLACQLTTKMSHLCACNQGYDIVGDIRGHAEPLRGRHDVTPS
jgi:hypothetical protein